MKTIAIIIFMCPILLSAQARTLLFEVDGFRFQTSEFINISEDESYIPYSGSIISALSDGKSCADMKTDHEPQGFKVTCGPTTIETLDGGAIKVKCLNTSTSFCAMVHESILPAD